MADPATPLEARVETLEGVMLELARAQRDSQRAQEQTHRALERFSVETQRSLDRLSREMVEFKNEMAEFKNEMAEFKNEMAEFKNEMAEFKNEMAEFKSRVDDHIRESRAAGERSTRELAGIAAAQGRLVENFVAPSVPRLLRSLLSLPEDEDLDLLAVRARYRHPTSKRTREFDVVAAHASTVFVVEAKSQLTAESIATFAERLPEVLDFLPGLAGAEVLGAVASVWVDPSLVACAERHGLAVLAAGDGLMTLANTPGFVPVPRRAAGR